MTANYVLLEKISVGAAGASSVTFSGIPQTGYTDLVVKSSTQQTSTSVAYATLKFNGSSANFTYRSIEGSGSTAGSFNGSTGAFGVVNPSGYTANTFANIEFYIPNYTSSNYKSYSSDSVTENNSTQSYADLIAGLWSNTAAITSIEITPGAGNFAQYSTFYLYGVAKLGTTPAIVPYATGGDTIMTDGTYWYHTFISSGTFTPQKAISCDYLVVAGGGGAAGNSGGGGGGAGGLRSTVTATGGGGSLETALSLGTSAYTVTIGAGGAGTGEVNANSGSNSVFATITSTGGGAGARNNSSGVAGGSGGGVGRDSTSAQTGGAGTTGQGYRGGNGISSGAGYAAAAGGGGAGAVGGNGSISGGPGTPPSGDGGNAGNGGNGVAVAISGSSVTYAGGGGGSLYDAGANTFSAGSGGSGGGGAGGKNAAGTNGTANTGGGGGGSRGVVGANGGSGIVIVRYAV